MRKLLLVLTLVGLVAVAVVIVKKKKEAADELAAAVGPDSIDPSPAPAE